MSTFAARPGTAYNAPQQPYRPPSAAFQQRGNFAERPSGYGASRGFDSYSAKQPKSGGFHPFGGDHEPKGFGGGKNFSSHQSDGGGHSGGHGGGKHRRVRPQFKAVQPINGSQAEYAA